MKQKEEFSVSKYMETEDYRQKKEIIKNEINKDKVDKDYSCFKKSVKEKLELKALKKKYNNYNGDKLTFYANLKDLLFAFSKAKSPNWGSFKFNGQLINKLLTN